jgi:hypothetical protein
MINNEYVFKERVFKKEYSSFIYNSVFFVLHIPIHAAGIPSTLSYTGLLTDTEGNSLRDNILL